MRPCSHTTARFEMDDEMALNSPGAGVNPSTGTGCERAWRCRNPAAQERAGGPRRDSEETRKGSRGEPGGRGHDFIEGASRLRRLEPEPTVTRGMGARHVPHRIPAKGDHRAVTRSRNRNEGDERPVSLLDVGFGWHLLDNMHDLLQSWDRPLCRCFGRADVLFGEQQGHGSRTLAHGRRARICQNARSPYHSVDATIGQLLRDVIAELGLPLYRLTTRLTSLDEVFLRLARSPA